MPDNQIPTEKIPDYDFSIIDMIKEGFRRIDGVKMTFVLAFLIYMAIAIVVYTVLGFIFPSSQANPNLLNEQITTILSYPVLIPVITGIMMLAVKYSRGEIPELKSIFDYYPMIWHLSLAGVLVYLMTLIGFVLLILPGIFLSIAFMFTMPLIADKGLGAWEAMEFSRKAVTKQWFKVFGLTLLLGLIIVAGALVLGIGLIWAIPLMFVTTYGLLYPLVFDGVEG